MTIHNYRRTNGHLFLSLDVTLGDSKFSFTFFLSFCSISFALFAITSTGWTGFDGISRGIGCARVYVSQSLPFLYTRRMTYVCVCVTSVYCHQENNKK